MTNGINYSQGLAANYITPPSGVTVRTNPITGLPEYAPVLNDMNVGGQSYSIDYNSQNGIQGVTEAGKALGPRVGATPNTGEKPGWFDPQGPSGRSLAGNVLGGVASGVGALSGLAGMYYGYEQMKMQKEMNKLQKDAYNRQVKKDEQQEARLKQLARNVGNEASY